MFEDAGAAVGVILIIAFIAIGISQYKKRSKSSGGTPPTTNTGGGGSTTGDTKTPSKRKG